MRNTDDTPLTRRGFIAGAGSVAGASALVAAVPAEAARRSPLPRWQQQADVIVVGAGCAAFTAAIFAAHAGAKVLILEKAGMIGGTTAKSSGVWWVPNNALMRRDGLVDEKADALRYMARCAYPADYNVDEPMLGLRAEEYALLEAYYDNASTATDALVALGVMEIAYSTGYDEKQYPDYYSHFPENKAPRGRGLRPLVPPSRAAQGGAEMIRKMAAKAKELGVETLVDHAVTDVVRNADGRVVGVMASQSGGPPIAFGARRGVVFGSGGFTHDLALVDAHLPGPIAGGCAVPTNTGDFIKIGMKLGTPLGHMNKAWWCQVVLEQALVARSVPDDVFFYPSGSDFLVNRHGRRAVNERMTYNERTQAHFSWDPVEGEYANQLLYLIYDERVRMNPGEGRYTYPLPAAGRDAPYVLKGATFEELTANIDARLRALIAKGQIGSALRLAPAFTEQLKRTAERFNGFAETGKDLDFGRGHTLVDRSFERAQPNGKPNPTLYPLASTGPYYCIIIAAGTLDTKGGPVVNAMAQVVDADRKPIPGLYGAGNCIASPAGKAYWGGGGTIGPALAYGYIAGRNAAAEKPVAIG